MKRTIKMISTICLVLLVVLVTGCGKKDSVQTKATENVKTTEKESKSNCKYYECLSKLSIENTIDEITDIIGIEPTKEDLKYIYDFGNEQILTVNTSSSNGSIITIAIDYDKDVIKNSKVDLSDVNSLKSKVNSGITYDEFVKEVGGVEGTLYELGSWNKYAWVAGDGKSYVNASFGNETGKCMFFSGMTY